MQSTRLRSWTAAVAAVAALSAGCAVYTTPSGDIIGPAPVVVSPAVVVAPPVVSFGFFGGYGGHYHAPRHYSRPYYGPRYYGRPYYRY